MGDEAERERQAEWEEQVMQIERWRGCRSRVRLRGSNLRVSRKQELGSVAVHMATEQVLSATSRRHAPRGTLSRGCAFT